jgi:pimeloyl-ACP methyl ester carboxylesterase
VVTIDMRGAGESDKPKDDYTSDLYADDLNSVIEEIQDKHIVVVGESMGCMAAIKYVTKYPGKAIKLVLVGGTPKVVSTSGYSNGYPLEVVQKLLDIFQQSYSSGLKTFMKMTYSELGTHYLRELGIRVFQKTTQEIAINSLSNYLKEDLRPLLGRIIIPTLILHGENDMAVTLSGAKYMHKNIPGSKMYVFKGKGHFPCITAAEKFNRIVEEFVRTGELLDEMSFTREQDRPERKD